MNWMSLSLVLRREKLSFLMSLVDRVMNDLTLKSKINHRLALTGESGSVEVACNSGVKIDSYT